MFDKDARSVPPPCVRVCVAAQGTAVTEIPDGFGTAWRDSQKTVFLFSGRLVKLCARTVHPVLPHSHSATAGPTGSTDIVLNVNSTHEPVFEIPSRYRSIEDRRNHLFTALYHKQKILPNSHSCVVKVCLVFEYQIGVQLRTWFAVLLAMALGYKLCYVCCCTDRLG